MQKNTPSDLWVSWDEYHALIERLAIQVHDSGWQFDQMVCLARGGLRIGDVFSRLFKKSLNILTVSSYRGETGQDHQQLMIGSHISGLSGELSGKVLLLDDLADSGLTFVEVDKCLRQRYAGITEMKSASLWAKSVSQLMPDYYVEYVEGSPWIHQPFEVYDSLTFAELTAAQTQTE